MSDSKSKNGFAALEDFLKRQDEKIDDAFNASEARDNERNAKLDALLLELRTNRKRLEKGIRDN